MSEQPINPRLAEDIQWREKRGPARYQNWTEKPVRYFTVIDQDDGSILGYVWAGDEDDAAFYEPRTEGGSRAVNHGMVWLNRLREGKGRGLRATQTLHELYGKSEPAGNGRPLPGSLAHAPNAAVVKALAQTP
ncbi:hypothetical protein [Streptomyces botrytidirepellens]|uniref:Uncharacterized protein n=1 Tax=Streptomyces botrytidirepellens TaxID=2486417 RepID=A0A3M8VYW5_9ACTN|nr:hypothetical protein [Streptomyces botrytidirepellens]RNG21631.1 hypothetical protein EEJ42_22270 [Streptomyces botrytidirepellens]